MNDLIEASCLNSAGAFQLVSGKTKEARAFFLKALNLIRDTVNYDEAGAKYVFLPRTSAIRLCHKGKEADTLPSHLQSDCFICPQPLLIDISDVDAVCDRTIILGSAVVLYNIALCHHGDGLQGQTNEIRKAHFLYKNCAVLLREFTDTTSSAVQILLMNNLASCHYELGDFLGACMKLREMVPVLSASGDHCEFILREVMNELIFNAMNMSSKTAISARAA